MITAGGSEMKPLVPLRHLRATEAEARYQLPSKRNLFHQRTPIISQERDAKELMEEIRCYVHNTMEVFEFIFDSFAKEEAFYIQPIHKLRHPMIFYYGHTSSFYINKLCLAGLTSHIDHSKEEMFAIGVDEMSWDDLNEGHYKWPSAADVSEYRLKVRDRLNQMMTSGKYSLTLPLTFENSTENEGNAFWWTMLMGAEHERIHIETASVHLRELPLHLVNPQMAQLWKRCPTGSTTTAPKNELVSIPQGSALMGRRKDSNMYGWDSDYSTTTQATPVAAFQTSKYLVSNAEFLDFMTAGKGYANPDLWDDEGKRWLSWRKPEHPWFWVKDASRPNGFALRLQVDLIDLPLDWPCEMNNLEAHAFCQYKSSILKKPVRMLTEEEWTLLFDRYMKHDQDSWPTNQPISANINLERYASSCPVSEFQHGDLYDVIGNVWQHTEDKVYPFDGYQVHPFYDDFSRPTFDGLHACMKGGAWISTGNEATRDARFAFRRHFFQFIGLRYVVGEALKERSVKKLEGVDAEVDAITAANYGPDFQGKPNISVQLAQLSWKLFQEFGGKGVAAARALNLFCGAGRLSYELSPHFTEVIGVDFSSRRLIPAFSLRERGDCEYLTGRGTPKEELHHVKIDAFPWAAKRESVTFFQSDPVNLHRHLDHFSMIVCWNCIETSYQPDKIPAHVLQRLLPGGILVIGIDPSMFKETLKEGLRKNPTYGSDALVVASTSASPKAPHDVIFELLGGNQAVERIGTPATYEAAFPSSLDHAVVRHVQVAAYRKK